MRKFFKGAFLVAVAAVMLAFAVANRQIVTFTIDPFGITGAELTAPLFVLAFVFLIVGVVIGGVAAWLRQGKWRRAARVLEHDVQELRADNEALRRQLEAAHAALNRSEAQTPALRPPAA